MNTLYVVGLGPGKEEFLTGQARKALEQSQVLCGYTVYVDLVAPLFPEKETYTSPMKKELDRCRWAMETAQSGKDVALVCSGDAVYTAWQGFCFSYRRNIPVWKLRLWQA